MVRIVGRFGAIYPNQNRTPSRADYPTAEVGHLAPSPSAKNIRCHPIAGLRHLMGVEEADAEIYRKHADDLIRFAAGLVGPSDAWDIVSEAFLGCLNSAGWMTVTEKRSYLFGSVYKKAAESIALRDAACQERRSRRDQSSLSVRNFVPKYSRLCSRSASSSGRSSCSRTGMT
jgi:hypothetical protein